MVKFLKTVKELNTGINGELLSEIEDITDMMIIPCKKAYWLSDMCELYVLYKNDTIGIFDGSSITFVTKEAFSGKISECEFDGEYIKEMYEKYGKLKD